ncbi:MULTISPECIES: DUF4878 domain-containing protein [unclassified Campylobacter]|uniref:DUF4878 domain-containing protein n=1 Tax=unclassified Campylobacter TaxID=2593542 RepID=UPI0012382EEC|nr:MULTISPECIES: DUF4878 domain-containing protein [unclassified Campylobacter]KAA6224664.1 DUF4878 domain-containing protein [Campylobacter sp. LR185c]KAA6225664.1 DUF4878 domain-containing protein [Campylobacter sp. LR286c]KAA6225784.1 DUF4878 domain-containing protein [Campylobacter sp. LR196d]KAA6229637.1 DUF4878 domain-containing protein [Campylobacter sp. LR291e]KAA8603995.1 hypothetical protein CGP82_04985 [Campylobacter sp. LR185c]
MLKKCLSWILALILVSFVACSSDSPGDVVKDFTNNAFNNKTEKMLSNLLSKEEMKEEFKKEGKKEASIGKMQMLAGRVQNMTASHGGLKSVEILEEKIEGDTAKVKARTNFKDGKSSDDNFRLRKAKDGWKIQLN